MDNILIRNSTTGATSFKLVTQGVTDTIDNRGPDTESVQITEDKKEMVVALRPSPKNLAAIKGEALLYLTGNVAVEVNGVLTGFVYPADKLVEAFADHLSIGFETNDIDPASGYNYRVISRDEATAMDVRIYSIGGTDSVTGVNRACEYVTVFDDRQYVGMGFRLPTNYNVSCVGAIPYSGAISFYPGTINPGDTFRIKDGKTIVSIEATPQAIVDHMNNVIGIEAAILKSYNDGSKPVMLFFTNKKNEDVHFQITGSADSFTAANMGSEGAVSIDPAKISICLAPYPGLAQSTPEVSDTMLEPTDSRVTVMTQENGYLCDPTLPESDGTTGTCIKLNDHVNFLAPDLSPDEIIKSNSLSLYDDTYMGETLPTLIECKDRMWNGPNYVDPTVGIFVRNVKSNRVAIQRGDGEGGFTALTKGYHLDPRWNTKVKGRFSADFNFVLAFAEGLTTSVWEKDFFGNSFPLFGIDLSNDLELSLLNFPADMTQFKDATVVYSNNDGGYYTFFGVTTDFKLYYGQLRLTEFAYELDYNDLEMRDFSTTTSQISCVSVGVKFGDSIFSVALGSEEIGADGCGLLVGEVEFTLDDIKLVPDLEGVGGWCNGFVRWDERFDNDTNGRTVWMDGVQRIISCRMEQATIGETTLTTTKYAKENTNAFVYGLRGMGAEFPVPIFLAKVNDDKSPRAVGFKPIPGKEKAVICGEQMLLDILFTGQMAFAEVALTEGTTWYFTHPSMRNAHSRPDELSRLVARMNISFYDSFRFDFNGPYVMDRPEAPRIVVIQNEDMEKEVEMGVFVCDLGGKNEDLIAIDEIPLEVNSGKGFYFKLGKASVSPINAPTAPYSVYESEGKQATILQLNSSGAVVETAPAWENLVEDLQLAYTKVGMELVPIAAFN